MSGREFVATSCICCGKRRLHGSAAVLMPFVAYRVFGHEPVEITPEWGMRDLKTGWSYTLCRSLECLDCGALFLDYRFTDEQMAALYAGYRDERYVRDRVRFEPGFASTIAASYGRRHAHISNVEEWLSRYVPEKPVVLDFGGDDGKNSPFLGKASRLQVHDISGVALVEGAERAEPSQFGTTHHDLIVCAQTLEHVAYPLDLLRQILPAMDSDTLLYVEVPFEDVMRLDLPAGEAATRKRHWHEHINFFSQKSMRILLQSTGLEPVAEFSMPLDIGYGQRFIQGYLARLAGSN